MFRVRGRCPRSSRAISNARYSGNPGLIRGLSGTGLSPSSALRSRRLLVGPLGCTWAQNTTSPAVSRRIRFALYRVRSPLLTASRLISFPPPTKMLQFGGFLLADASSTRRWKDVPFGNPGINDSVRLPRAYRGLARPSSAPEPSHPPDSVAAVSRIGSGYLLDSRMHQRPRAARSGRVARSTYTLCCVVQDGSLS